VVPSKIAATLKKAGRELKSDTSSTLALSLFINKPAKEETRFTAMIWKIPFKLLSMMFFSSTVLCLN
jgi:hypothetical protein